MVVPQDGEYGNLLEIIPGAAEAAQSGKGKTDDDPIVVPEEVNAKDFHAFLGICYPMCVPISFVSGHLRQH